MSHTTPIDFDALRIATPCTVSWEAMTGDARKRHCGQCRLNVYDVSELTRGEAESLLREGEGRVCMRLHRRADGRIITKDCGRVRAAIERRVRWMRAAAASILAFVGLSGCSRSDGADPKPEPAAPGTTAVPPSGDMMGLVALPDRSEMGKPVAPVPSPETGSEMGDVVHRPEPIPNAK